MMTWSIDKHILIVVNEAVAETEHPACSIDLELRVSASPRVRGEVEQNATKRNILHN